MATSPDQSNTALVSVVVPVHNGAHWLAPTLDALLKQSYSRFEVILVDDASIDGLDEVLLNYQDPRIRVVHLETNVGVSAARNHGIQQARGSYIAFCDADDIPMPHRLELQVAFLDGHPKIGICGSAFICFDSEDRQLVENPEHDDEIKLRLMIGNCFGLSTIMARSELFARQRFDEGLRVAEDYDLWTRMAVDGVVLANLRAPLLRYRWHTTQASREGSFRLDQVSRKIRGIYCAGLLGSQPLQESLRIGQVTLQDMRTVARLIKAKGREPAPFRFMLAWMYQLLPDHGFLTWLRWRRIQHSLNLSLDKNYVFNTFLLAIFQPFLAEKQFDTLIKLKR
jgi:glycosyltransferase involved in cell wall biosynthesis